jgi:hypothetical protein
MYKCRVLTINPGHYRDRNFSYQAEISAMVLDSEGQGSRSEMGMAGKVMLTCRNAWIGFYVCCFSLMRHMTCI